MFESTISEADNNFISFLPNIGSYYSNRRNYSRDPYTNENTTSLLSPYIRYRILSEEKILNKVLNTYNFNNAEKYIQEIFWRTYWKGWLEFRPEVYDDYLTQRNILKLKLSKQTPYLNAINGKTKFKFFNQWVKEILSNGYLHNHIRMWFASIWIFNLKLPWQLGADFFMQHLLDGDPASNTLSWRWIAGIQTKGKNYIARKDNIEKYSNIKISQSEILDEKVEPIIEDKIFTMKELNLNEIADFKIIKAIVIPTDELNFLKDFKINCNAFFGCPFEDYNDHKFNDKIINHIRKITLSNLKEDNYYTNVNYEIHFENYYTMLKKWININNINEIYLPYVTRGNWVKIYKNIIMHNPSVNFIIFNRNYDAKSWIYSKKGYFNFKKNIPNIIKNIF